MHSLSELTIRYNVSLLSYSMLILRGPRPFVPLAEELEINILLGILLHSILVSHGKIKTGMVSQVVSPFAPNLGKHFKKIKIF